MGMLDGRPPSPELTERMSSPLAAARGSGFAAG